MLVFVSVCDVISVDKVKVVQRFTRTLNYNPYDVLHMMWEADDFDSQQIWSILVSTRNEKSDDEK